jgi:hypothetical protein
MVWGQALANSRCICWLELVLLGRRKCQDHFSGMMFQKSNGWSIGMEIRRNGPCHETSVCGPSCLNRANLNWYTFTEYPSGTPRGGKQYQGFRINKAGVLNQLRLKACKYKCPNRASVQHKVQVRRLRT